MPCVASAGYVVSMTRGQGRTDYELTSGQATFYSIGAARISEL